MFNIIKSKVSSLRVKHRILIVTALMLSTANIPVYSENASNPLAAVNNTDVRLQYFDLEGGADRRWSRSLGPMGGGWSLHGNTQIKTQI